MNKSNIKMYALKVKNSLNYKEFERDHEVNTLPSLTIPDQNMSIRQIIDNYTRGLPVNSFNPIYDGEDYDLPDPRTLDLVERHEMAERIKEEVASIKSREWKKTQDVENTVENLKNDVEKTPI
jgi:hypothetical protein